MSTYPIIRNRSGTLYRALSTDTDTEPIEPLLPLLMPPPPKGSSLFRRWQVLLIVFVVVVMLYPLSSVFTSRKFNADRWPKINSAGQLTIVMNTFKRNDMMLDATEHYRSCLLVKHIYIIWSESQPPPERISAKFQGWKHPTVDFLRQDVDSLNNRFKPLPGARTDAIFSVDDDMRVDCEDLNLAYEVWRGSQRSMVGFMPRLHLRRNGLLEYRCWLRVWWHGQYSMVLTKAALLHHDFLKLYWSDAHAKVGGRGDIFEIPGFICCISSFPITLLSCCSLIPLIPDSLVPPFSSSCSPATSGARSD